jgi:hypothetical protein
LLICQHVVSLQARATPRRAVFMPSPAMSVFNHRRPSTRCRAATCAGGVAQHGGAAMSLPPFVRAYAAAAHPQLLWMGKQAIGASIKVWWPLTRTGTMCVVDPVESRPPVHSCKGWWYAAAAPAWCH